MNNTANIAITYADVPGFPEGTVLDHISVSVTDAAGTSLTQTVAPGTGEVDFPDLQAGNYAVVVVGNDASGAALGTPVQAGFIINGITTVTISLPSTVVASVS